MNTLLAIPVSMNFLRQEKKKERKKGKDREEGIRDRETGKVILGVSSFKDTNPIRLGPHPHDLL